MKALSPNTGTRLLADQLESCPLIINSQHEQFFFQGGTVLCRTVYMCDF